MSTHENSSTQPTADGSTHGQQLSIPPAGGRGVKAVQADTAPDTQDDPNDLPTQPGGQLFRHLMIDGEQADLRFHTRPPSRNRTMVSAGTRITKIVANDWGSPRHGFVLLASEDVTNSGKIVYADGISEDIIALVSSIPDSDKPKNPETVFSLIADALFRWEDIPDNEDVSMATHCLNESDNFLEVNCTDMLQRGGEAEIFVDYMSAKGIQKRENTRWAFVDGEGREVVRRSTDQPWSSNEGKLQAGPSASTGELFATCLSDLRIE